MRKVFLLPFGGPEAYKHYQDTIARKRSLKEAAKFFGADEINTLYRLYHGREYAVWGARNTEGNINVYRKMDLGDYVIFVGQGKVSLVAEVSFKANSPAMAEYLWSKNTADETWENIYFLINEREVNVPMEKLNSLLGYKENFRPQGFAAIDEGKLNIFQKHYGDIADVLVRLSQGLDIVEKDEAVQEQKNLAEELPKDEEPVTTEHTEMQWRLIRLAQAAGNDVWVPRSDQGRSFDGNTFRGHVLSEFSPGLDIPKTIENIDVVWKYGRNNITSAFEVEHSTSIYSGILRLSDLVVEAPNSIYPLFIVADKERKYKVFDQLKRPTFSAYGLKLDQKVGYLDYDTVRKLDHEYVNKENSGLSPDVIKKAADFVT